MSEEADELVNHLAAVLGSRTISDTAVVDADTLRGSPSTVPFLQGAAVERVNRAAEARGQKIVDMKGPEWCYFGGPVEGDPYRPELAQKVRSWTTGRWTPGDPLPEYVNVVYLCVDAKTAPIREEEQRG